MSSYKIENSKELAKVLKKLNWKKIKYGSLLSPNKEIKFLGYIFQFLYKNEVRQKHDDCCSEPVLYLPYSNWDDDGENDNCAYDVIDIIFDDVTNLLQIGNLFAINLNQGNI